MDTIQKLQQALKDKNIAFSVGDDEDADPYLVIALKDEKVIELMPTGDGEEVFLDYIGIGSGFGIRLDNVETAVTRTEELIAEHGIAATIH